MRRKITCGLFGILYGISCVFGYQAQCYREIRFRSGTTYLWILLWSVIAGLFGKVLWDLMSVKPGSKASGQSQNGLPGTQDGPSNVKRVWIMASASLFLLWFVVFLGVYPGFFVYDANEELMETVLRSFHTQHPLLHVLSLGGIIQGVHKLTGDYNLSIALFILFQMTVMAIASGYLIMDLYRRKCDRIFLILFTLFLGIFPVPVMYALCSSKDGMFGAFLLLTVLWIRKFTVNPEAFVSLRKSKDAKLLILFAALMMLYRNNGVYAFLVFGAVACFCLFAMDKREYTAAKLFLIAVLSYGVLTRGMELATGARDVGHREILTVPIQQMARIYAYDQGNLTEEEKARIETYLPEEALRSYNPKCADPVKIAFREEEYLKDKKAFYTLWGTLGIKHLPAYLDAWVMTSYGLWYPNAVLDGYRGNQVFTFVYGDSSYFGYETEEPGVRKPLLPYIDDFYRWISLDPKIQRMPVVSLLFSPGFLFWVMLFFTGFFIYAGRIDLVLPYLLPLFVVLTCFLGPMSLVRYVHYLWVFVPVMMAEWRGYLRET